MGVVDAGADDVDEDIAGKVIGDFRAPDMIRFGFTPLYLDASDIDAAVAVLADVMSKRLWDNPQYRQSKKVT